MVVNDLGGDTTGKGQSTRAADKVVDEIRQAGKSYSRNLCLLRFKWEGTSLLLKAHCHLKKKDAI